MYVEKDAQITAKTRKGIIYTGIGLGNGVPVEIPVYYNDTYEVSAIKNNSPTNTVMISTQDKQSTNVYLSFVKLSIKSNPGTAITVSKGEYSYSIEQSSGLDVIYLPELGDWIMNAGNVTKIIKVFTYKQYDVTTFPYKVMTAIIDQSNSDPATCVTYADDATSMTAGNNGWDEFFGHYPCLFKDGVEICRLNPNNFAEVEDGTPIDITSGVHGDVVIAFPKRGLKLETIDNKVYVKMTDNTNDSNFGYLGHTRGEEQREIFYVAAFEGSVTNEKLRSLPNVGPSSSISFTDFRKYAKANGEGYELCTFYQWTFLQAMYVLKYSNLNVQSVIGYGRCSVGAQITGSTVNKGMDYGSSDNTSMKLFGIEDLYGNLWDCVDGMNTNSSGQFTVATTNFNNNCEGYDIYNASLSNIRYGYITSVEGTTELGFTPKTVGGSDGMYFSDWVYLSPSCVLYIGGDFQNDKGSGIFCSHIATDASYAYSTIGARFSYY